MTIEVNKVAYIKTTDEPVFVLSIVGEDVLVKRPIQADTGVSHKTETFTIYELQTKKAQIVAEMELNEFMLGERDKLSRKRQDASCVELPEREGEPYLN